LLSRESGEKMKKMTIGFSIVMMMVFSSTVFARQPLTFEERVKAQEAIERVYYNHRIWPKENPQPKPPFEKMITKEQIEAKVNDYLKKCSALDKFWQRPIIASQLQAEMDRMAKGSKDPATLNELFAALNNDPYLIAECLARPVLADRLIHNWYANDSRFHAETKAKAEEALTTLTPENFCSYPEGNYSKMSYKLEIAEREEMGWIDPEDRSIKLSEEEFAKMLAEIPDEGKISGIQENNDSFVILRTISKNDIEIEVECLVFTKQALDEWFEKQDLPVQLSETENSSTNFYLSPMPEDACTEEWKNSKLDDYPDARGFHTGVWTGTEMIIWGGKVSISKGASTGGRYNPSTDTWTPTSVGSNVPSHSDYASHSAVWTGSVMIVWGGNSNSGGRYNPTTDTWTATSTGTNCPATRMYNTAVWTGTEMIIWGGLNGGTYLNSGGIYNPSNDTWGATSTGTNCPVGRYYHTAVWTNSEMIVWGGAGGPGNCLNTGGRYNPLTDTWTETSTETDCPSARIMHTAVWTGINMVVWGGNFYGVSLNTGGIYDPLTDTWKATSTGTNCPPGRGSPTAIWTGSEMIVWGGLDGANSVNTGGRYSPSTNTWGTISTGTNCPSARLGHTAVWTNSEMIIWGGAIRVDNGNDSYLNTGGRYDPSNDTWTAVSAGINVPSGRYYHTAFWTGAEMIVWGGMISAEEGTNTGGRYNPSTDSWTATSTGTNCPSARYVHTAVWTGTEMIIWGGYNNSTSFVNTGGRYNPSTNAWTATSTGSNVPSRRDYHTAIWTGTEMIVWGGYYGSYLNTGGRYNPSTNAWTATSTGTNVPSIRDYHTAIWTGTEMIVWGGYGSSPTYKNDGGRYNPSTNTWTATSTGTNCPTGREYHTAVWADNEMIIWGGYSFSYLNTGGRYNPSTNTWTATSTGTNCPVARRDHTAVWTGSEMIIWGGYNGSILNTGSTYYPSANSWTATSTGTNCPAARRYHTAVWTSSGMVVWGGEPCTQSGGIYWTDPYIVGFSDACVGSSILLSCQSYYSAYQWYKDGSEISEATLNTYTATQSGDYFVRVTRQDGCTVDSDVHTVTIYPLPMPSVISAASGCSESGAALSTGSFSTYQWNLNGAPIVGATAQIYQAMESGNYSVTVTGTGGCQATSSPSAVTIYSIPPAVTGASSACTGSSTTLSTGSYPSYQWSKDGVPIDGATNQTLDVSQPGTYTVFANVPAASCSGTSEGHAVQFAPPPSTPPVISGASSNSCPSTSVALQTTETFGTYQWYFNGAPISGATAQSFNASLSGDYTVSAGAVSGCQISSIPISVSISFCPPSEVSPKSAVYPSRVTSDAGSSTGYYLYFQKIDGATGYNIYEGNIGGWYSHSGQPGNICNATVTDLATGEMRTEVTPSAGNHYYLITAYADTNEGPSGFDSNGVEIDSGQSTCSP
jgi:hypothetical protein